MLWTGNTIITKKNVLLAMKAHAAWESFHINIYFFMTIFSGMSLNFKLEAGSSPILGI